MYRFPNFLMLSAALAVVGVPALAGGMAEPAPAPMVLAAAPQPQFDWTGFFVGVQVGFSDTETSFFGGAFDLQSDARHFGLQGGYLHDFGNIVVGGMLSYEQVDVSDVAFDDDPTRLGLSGIVGYDVGRFLPYATLGLTRLDLPDFDTTENGTSFGIGMMFAVTDRVMANVEYTRTEYDDYLEDFIPDSELTADTVRLGVNYRF